MAPPTPSAAAAVDALSTVAANHLALAQFEPFRAALITLRSLDSDRARSILRFIVSHAGRINNIVFSPSCPSPPHLAWLSFIELAKFGSAPAEVVHGLDLDGLGLVLEFLLLIQEVLFEIEGKSEGGDVREQGILSGIVGNSKGVDSEEVGILKKVLEVGFGMFGGESGSAEVVSEEELRSLWKVFVEKADAFEAVSEIIGRIKEMIEVYRSEMAVSLVPGDGKGSVNSIGDQLDVLALLQKSIQLAHLDAMKKSAEEDDLEAAFSHLRFLHLGFGVEEVVYKEALRDFVQKAFIQSNHYGKSWLDSWNRMTLMYAAALSSHSVQLVEMIQVIHDELIYEEIELHTVSDAKSIPLPLKKYLDTLSNENVHNLDMKTSPCLIRSCMRDLYHYARISGAHVLECIMDTALSAIKREELREASQVLSLFPLLQPLVATLGWDLLSGKTRLRRNLMQLLWISKSQALRLEEFPIYKKKFNEISCVEHLCDILCFHLDFARYVACVNSGQLWNSKNSLLFGQKVEVGSEDNEVLDPFVENFILERLAVHTPMRVLFDVVPGIKFKDAIELLSMQPITSTVVAWKRLQDVELIHMRYALESAAFALGAIGKCGADDDASYFHLAISYLRELQNHMEAIKNASRKIFMVGILSSLLYLDETVINITENTLLKYYPDSLLPLDQYNLEDGRKRKAICFTRILLDILSQNIPTTIPEMDNMTNSSLENAAREVLQWRVVNAKHFLEDWEWRLSVLERLQPLYKRQWSWKEALVILRSAPSKLLNLFMQKAKYDIGEEAVRRFSLPPEDKATLELAEWVAGAFRRATAEDAVSRVAEGTSTSIHELDVASLRNQIGPLAAILLCIDTAATSAKSMAMCKFLVDQATNMLSEIFPGRAPQKGPTYWDQIKILAMISVIKRIIKRMHDLLEQENAPTLQEVLAGEATISNELTRHGQWQRTIMTLHQTIDDAHQGKRQFLSGKLHNLARALADDDLEGNSSKGEGSYADNKTALNMEKGAVFGLGLRPSKSASGNIMIAEQAPETGGYEGKDSGKMYLGPLTSKPSTYLSAFIIHIAMIGDIVDGADTTHDFNFFSVVYEWPKDLLTRLVFERGSTDAAGKLADIMGVDFVHEVISACVPPVFPSRSGHGWACIPVLATHSDTSSDNKSPFPKASANYALSEARPNSLYPLQMSLVAHLAKLSPVRAVLACVFGSTILATGSEPSSSGDSRGLFVQAPETEREFYEFALDQSERFPTLNRWIQMQSNLHRVSETEISSESVKSVAVKSEGKLPLKRHREPENDAESEVDDMASGACSNLILPEFRTGGSVVTHFTQDSPKHRNSEFDSASFISFDWENEVPYRKAVERLIDDGKLMDALALSDRCLPDGASDRLLQLLIERGEEQSSDVRLSHSYGVQSFGSSSWQYCLRLKDKKLAANLALKYLHRWDLDPAIDVLTMCSCHLSQNDSLRDEVLQMRQALQRYHKILSADDRYSSWQDVQADCKRDPEGLAIRLANKGAVYAALEVAESASLSIHLRRELQGQQLVKLLTADPLSGGGPAEASRFLSSLRDSDDALPVAIGAMQLLPDLRSKQLLVHFFLKRRAGNLSDSELSRLNLWALGLRILALLPQPFQKRCSALHEHPHLILEVLLMMKQFESVSLILKKFPSMKDDKLILSYAAKAITVNVSSAPREPRLSIIGSRSKQKAKSGMPSKSNFATSISNLQREARRAFSWTNRDSAQKTTPPKDSQRKRKISGFGQSDRVAWEAETGNQEQRVPTSFTDGQERLPFVSPTEEWVLTGEPMKDDSVRASHRYETSPDIVLFKALLSLCSDELSAAKGALKLCVSQMMNVLSSQHLPSNASMEIMSRAYHATEIYVQALTFAKSQLRKLAGTTDASYSDRSRETDDGSFDTASSSTGSQCSDELTELLVQADVWLGRAELLQSLLGSGINASLDDIADQESSASLCSRLILDERYSMAVYTCKKCKIDAFPVWNAWGHALLRMEHYAQARVKFKQALQLHKDDPELVILDIMNTIEGGPPVDVSSARSMYEHLAKSAPTILDDSLSADAYLNVLYMPSTFPRSEKSRRSQQSSSNQSSFSSSDLEDGPRSNLDNIRYAECIHYLQEYARPQILAFMFRHGHYSDACSLFFPQNSLPLLPQPSIHGPTSSSTAVQRSDPLATDYGTIDDLCDLCIDYGAIDVLEDIVSERIASAGSEDSAVSQYSYAALTRICNYCETHRHFNYLYKFLVIKGDHVAAGLCCIQLFMNSCSQDEAIKHLEHAKTHFEEGLSARHKAGNEASRLISKLRGKSASEKLTEEELVKLSGRVAIQVEVVKVLNDTDGPQWKHSLFGNPSESETFRRRCMVAETLAEKRFDLAFQVIYEFNLPAVDIYAGVAASLAERKRGSQLTDFLKNIKGTIEDDDWDQVLGAAINVYANKHKERPDRLIDMLISNHRKVLACVVCGRLKSAFQIASRNGSVADVEYVAHQALVANALPVVDLCRQWLVRYTFGN